MAKERSAFRNRAEELACRGALALLHRFPPERVEALGARAGLLFQRLSASRRRLAGTNLARAFPELTEADRQRLARDVFAHFGAIAADLLVTIGEEPQELLSRIEIAGAEQARAAVAEGRGVFFLTAHLGNWEVAAMATASLGIPITVIARPLDNPLLERHLRAFRERTGNTVLPKADAAREMLRVIRRGGAIGILIDQHARPPDAVAAPFFGRPAATSSFLARLVDRTEALVVPTVALRTGARRYRVEYSAPLDPRRLGREERTTEALTARLNAVTEEMVRRAPDQWLWLHNRWRLD